MGWTQEIASQHLEPYLGKRWSVASFSDAERSADNGRTREFDANELLAFARAFGKREHGGAVAGDCQVRE